MTSNEQSTDENDDSGGWEAIGRSMIHYQLNTLAGDLHGSLHGLGSELGGGGEIPLDVVRDVDEQFRQLGMLLQHLENVVEDYHAPMLAENMTQEEATIFAQLGEDDGDC